jgi:hypothetical protein
MPCTTQASLNVSQNTINRVKVIRRGGTLDAGEKVKIEVLSRVSMIHPANGIAISPRSPLVCPVIPHHTEGEVLLENDAPIGL